MEYHGATGTSGCLVVVLPDRSRVLNISFSVVPIPLIPNYLWILLNKLYNGSEDIKDNQDVGSELWMFMLHHLSSLPALSTPHKISMLYLCADVLVCQRFAYPQRREKGWQTGCSDICCGSLSCVTPQPGSDCCGSECWVFFSPFFGFLCPIFLPLPTVLFLNSSLSSPSLLSSFIHSLPPHQFDFNFLSSQPPTLMNSDYSFSYDDLFKWIFLCLNFPADCNPSSTLMLDKRAFYLICSSQSIALFLLVRSLVSDSNLLSFSNPPHFLTQLSTISGPPAYLFSPSHSLFLFLLPKNLSLFSQLCHHHS